MGEFIVKKPREHIHDDLPDRETCGLGSVWECVCGETWQLVGARVTVDGRPVGRKWINERTGYATGELKLHPKGDDDERC